MTDPAVVVATEVEEPGDGAAFVMPLDAYFGSPTDIDVYTEELNAVVAEKGVHTTECVREGGFAFYTAPQDIRAPQELTYGTRSDLLPRDLYGVAGALEERNLNQQANDSVVAANMAGIAGLSDDTVAAFGAVVFECMNEAYEIYPEPSLLASRPTGLAAEIERERYEMAGDPGFALIWSDWSDCMKRAGYDFANRDEARQSLFPAADRISQAIERSSPERPVPDSAEEELVSLRDLEQAMVEQDLLCVGEVNLDSRFTTLQFDLETKIIEDNGDRWSVLRLDAESDN